MIDNTDIVLVLVASAKYIADTVFWATADDDICNTKSQNAETRFKRQIRAIIGDETMPLMEKILENSVEDTDTEELKGTGA